MQLPTSQRKPMGQSVEKVHCLPGPGMTESIRGGLYVRMPFASTLTAQYPIPE
jgi:hypothetical protein